MMDMDVRFEAESALLVIDMLNDFIEDGGSLVVPGARRIVPRLARILAGAREQGIPVIYITDSHREDDHEFRYWPAHAVSDTWGGEVIDALKPAPGEYIIPKRRYSAFFGTDLDTYLREMEVRRIYLTGVLTNICVYATALDAAMRNYGVSVFRDAVASLSEETDRFIFQQLEDVVHAELL
ncbi:MAG: cysteine hydrolase [Actinomycetota bacterium]|nr:cysteine hydrolase [Actinomycetota bacterium]